MGETTDTSAVVETAVVTPSYYTSERKFKLVVFILVVNTLAYYVGRFTGIDLLSENSFTSLTTLIFTGYIIGNVAQKVFTK